MRCNRLVLTFAIVAGVPTSLGGDLRDDVEFARTLVQRLYPEVAARSDTRLTVCAEELALAESEPVREVRVQHNEIATDGDVIEFWFEASHGLLRYFLRTDAAFARGTINRDARLRHDCESLAELTDAESYEILREERGRIYVRYKLRQAEDRLSGSELAHFDARTGALLMYGRQSPPTYPGAMSTPDVMPPVAVVGTLQVTATVTKIDYTTREVTLESDDGQKYGFVADDAVKNFAQVKKGDIVTADLRGSSRLPSAEGREAG